jgi:21S rRNA (GM2251-2'-O)-methyltransferase
MPLLSHLTGNAEETTPSDSLSRHITVIKQQSIATSSKVPEKIASFQSNSPHTIVAVLNDIVDPQNVGSIIRSAHFFGLAGVVLPTRNTADLSSGATLKAASGAAEAVNVFGTADVERFIAKSRKEGWMVLAAELEDSPGVDSRPHRAYRKKKEQLVVGQEEPVLKKLLQRDGQPVLVVLGGEERGVRKDLLWNVNGYLSVPRKGVDSVGVDSLNVGVAAGIIFAELTRMSKIVPAEKGKSEEEAEKLW